MGKKVRGKQIKGREAAETAETSTPTTAASLKDRGNTAIANGDAPSAVRLYTEAINLDPLNHLLFSNRAVAHSHCKEYEASLADGTRCTELNPEWPKGYCRKGAALFSLDRYAEAASVYEAALRLAPDDSAVLAALIDARKASQRKEVENSIQPAVMDFARCICYLGK